MATTSAFCARARRREAGIGLRVAALLAALSLLTAGCVDTDDDDGRAADAPDASTTTTSTEPGGADTGPTDVSDIVREVQPGVVAITTRGGEGSGVVYDSGGLIVTNSHVVGGAEEVGVLYADGRTADAEVLGTDAWLDLAVLRSDRTDVEGVQFAADLPDVGEPAIAMGNPLGFENSVTLGIISGLERSIPGGGPPLVGLIQTDAAISPGNSGGALVNAEAEVIGINIAYLPPQAGAVSLGFAVPAPLVVDAVEELVAEGEVDHPYLGIGPATLTEPMARQFGIEADAGVVAVRVAPGGPAAEAGIEPGDVITEIDGTQIDALEDLFSLLRELDGGETISLSVVRGSETMTLELRLGTRPSGRTG